MAITRGPYSDTDLQDLAAVIRGKRNPHVLDIELLGALLNEWLVTNDLADLSLFPDVPAGNEFHDFPDDDQSPPPTRKSLNPSAKSRRFPGN